MERFALKYIPLIIIMVSTAMITGILNTTEIPMVFRWTLVFIFTTNNVLWYNMGGANEKE